MDKRLRHDALTDMAARAEYASLLRRQGDVRGDVIAASIEVDKGMWGPILSVLEDDLPPKTQAVMARDLEPFFSHWPTRFRAMPEHWNAPLCDGQDLPLATLCRTWHASAGQIPDASMRALTNALTSASAVRESCALRFVTRINLNQCGWQTPTLTALFASGVFPPLHHVSMTHAHVDGQLMHRLLESLSSDYLECLSLDSGDFEPTAF